MLTSSVHNDSFYNLNFFGIKRSLPISYLSPRLKMANFTILGDVELTEKAGEELEKRLRDMNIIPDCFVGPEVQVVPLVHNLATRFGHNRYVILRKQVYGYMREPLIEHPWNGAPKHTNKLVLNGIDKNYLQGKRVVIVDDVVSTGSTMKMLLKLMKEIEAEVLTQCAIFKQGERYTDTLLYLSELPLLNVET
jgi:adenine phosphoribosyltransferase